MKNYQESEKEIVRKEALTNAIQYLTKDRFKTTIAYKSYLKDAKEALINKYKDGGNYGEIAYQLTDETIERWENFYESIVQSKKQSELKIAYLCGPNPLNDLHIMIDLGVLPENVWTFELGDNEYSNAVMETLNSKYPYLKIIKGDMSIFFEYNPIKFDIIYFDACAPLPSPSSKTLKSLVSIFKNHKLNSPGALITNFSLPTLEQDTNTNDSIAKIVGAYLNPKAFLENNEDDSDSRIKDGAEAYGYIYGEKEWNEIVASDLDNYYGQYITRFINDIASVIVPYQKIFNSKEFLKIFFKDIFYKKSQDKLNKELKEKLYNFTHFTNDDEGGYGGDIYVDSMLYSILISVYYIDDLDKKNKFFKSFFNELSILKNKDMFVDAISFIFYIFDQGDGQEKYYSDSLQTLSNNWNAFSRHYLCDVFLFHQLKELLARQLCVPYHLNIEKTDRWTYKAKKTQMFTDLLVFDECRYLYDWMPTLDMLEANLNNIDMELSIRLILDSVSKHTLYYNKEYFFGTSALDIGIKGFEGKVLKKRKNIKS